jgi:DNA-binding CsgD family transcriptional regulator
MAAPAADDEQVTNADQAALVDRLESALRRCRNVESLSGVVFGKLRSVVPFSFGCLASTDPMTGVVTWAYKSHPLPVGDEQWAVMEYGGDDLNQFGEIAGRPVPVAALFRETGGEVDRCRRMRDFLRPRFGFTDEVRVAFRSRGLIWGALALYRGEGEPPFSAAEARALAGVEPSITNAIRALLFSADFVGDGAAPEPAVIVVDVDGRPREMTRAARDRIEDLGGWDNGSLPAGLLAVAANARTGKVITTRTQLASRHWLTMRGTALEGPAETAGVVVVIDVTRPAELTGVTLIGRGLTAREQDIVNLVVQGAATKAIAGTLHLSPHTVQDHLKAVFAKLGVNSRRQLISQLYG